MLLVPLPVITGVLLGGFVCFLTGVWWKEKSEGRQCTQVQKEWIHARISAKKGMHEEEV